MVAQDVALLVALPVIYVFLRHPGFRKDAIETIRLWAILAVAAAYAGATDRCGNPILLALIAAVVQAAVVWVLRRIWPELPLAGAWPGGDRDSGGS